MNSVNHNNLPGWLLVLCALLLVYQPVSLALTASRALDALMVRGLPMALVLVAQGLVTAFGIAAGLALVGRRPGAVTMAISSLVLSAATDVFIYSTPFLPSNRFPGTTLLYVAGSLAYYSIWLAYLLRSKRVRDIFAA
jgi:hypothetical protein